MRSLQLPRFGQIMERGVLTEWCVSEGDTFRTGDALYEVETEKSSLTVEAKFDGIVARRMVDEGTEVPVGAVLALCWEPGEEQDPEVLERAARSIGGPGEGDTGEESSESKPAGQGGVTSGDNLPAGTPNGTEGRVRPLASPRVRRLAEQYRVDIAHVTGTGPDGLITEADVKRAASAGHQQDAVDPRADVTVIRPTNVQRTMAEVMRRSWSEIPQFVQTRHFDAGNLVSLRRRFRDMGQDVSFTDLIVYVAARVIRDHPLVNAEFRADGILAYREVNMAVAIETPAGLVTPVLRSAHAHTLGEISDRIRDLADRARGGRLVPADFDGATITLSNLGMFGVEWGTPIINPPQSTVIFVGALRDRLVLRSGAPVAIPEMALSIAFDHRVIDGATAARFTAALCSALQEPDALVPETA